MIDRDDVAFWACLIIANVWMMSGGAEKWISVVWLVMCAVIRGRRWMDMWRDARGHKDKPHR